MSTYQKMIIIGFLGSEPLTKNFENGGQLTQLSIATTESWIDKGTNEKRELTEWHRVILNGKLSELADKYLKKGSKVLIEGKLRTRKYLDNQNIERYTTEIVGSSMTFMGGGNNAEQTGSAVDEYNNKNNASSNVPAPSPGSDGDEHDDLPF